MVVLVIQDNPQEMALLREALTNFTNPPILVEHADRLSVALSYLAVRGFDAVLLDLNLPDSAGLDTFARVHARAPAMAIQSRANKYAQRAARKIKVLGISFQCGGDLT